MKEVAVVTKPTTAIGGSAQKKQKETHNPPPPDPKRKSGPAEVHPNLHTNEGPRGVKVIANLNYPKIRVPSTTNRKGEPILVSIKVIGDPMSRKIMQTMILSNDYDVAIHIEQEEHNLKLDLAWYNIIQFS